MFRRGPLEHAANSGRVKSRYERTRHGSKKWAARWGGILAARCGLLSSLLDAEHPVRQRAPNQAENSSGVIQTAPGPEALEGCPPGSARPQAGTTAGMKSRRTSEGTFARVDRHRQRRTRPPDDRRAPTAKAAVGRRRANARATGDQACSGVHRQDRAAPAGSHDARRDGQNTPGDLAGWENSDRPGGRRPAREAPRWGGTWEFDTLARRGWQNVPEGSVTEDQDGARACSYWAGRPSFRAGTIPSGPRQAWAGPSSHPRILRIWSPFRARLGRSRQS